MKIFDRCNWEECQAKPLLYKAIDGYFYCSDHYDPALELHLLIELNNCKNINGPSNKFINLFDRYVTYLLEKDLLPDALRSGMINGYIDQFIWRKNGFELRLKPSVLYSVEQKILPELEQRWKYEVEKKQFFLLGGFDFSSKDEEIKENEGSGLEIFPLFVTIRRQWNSWRIGEIDFYNLRSIKWDWTSGGVNAPSPHPFIHAYVLCDQIIGEIDHSCMHGPAPHSIKVVIVKKDNTAEVWKIIQGIAGPKPK